MKLRLNLRTPQRGTQHRNRRVECRLFDNDLAFDAQVQAADVVIGARFRDGQRRALALQLRPAAFDLPLVRLSYNRCSAVAGRPNGAG